jgi:hypothetical protein
VGASWLKERALGAGLCREDGLLKLVEAHTCSTIDGDNPNTERRFKCRNVELGSASFHFIDHCDGKHRWKSEVENLREYKEARLEIGTVSEAHNDIGTLGIGIGGKGMHHYPFVIRRWMKTVYPRQINDLS